MSKFKIQIPESEPELQESDVSNYLKLQFLLRRANQVLRNRFRQAWKEFSNSDWNDDIQKNCSIFINGIGLKVFQNLGKIQMESVSSGNIDNWDLTTLTEILLNVKFYSQTGRSEYQHFKALREVRNKSAHNPQVGTILDTEFEELWLKGANALIGLGDDASEIGKIKQSTNLAKDFDYQQDQMAQVRVGGWSSARSNTDFDLPLSGQVAQLLTIYANGIFYFQMNAEKAKLQDQLMELTSKGNALAEKGKHMDSLAVFTEAINLEGLEANDLATLYSSRSATYIQLIRNQGPLDQANNGEMSLEEFVKEALRDAKEALKLRPAWFEAYSRAGDAYYELTKYQKAATHFDCALNLAPGNDDDSLIHRRDECRRRLGIDLRNEQVDLRQMPKTKIDLLNQLRKQHGMPLNMEMLNKCLSINEKLIPGKAELHQALLAMEEPGAWHKNYEKAAGLLTKSSSLGNAEGTYQLALLYNTGCGVKQDFKRYIKLLKVAASKSPYNNFCGERTVGVAEAEHSLGLAYHEGVGVPQNWTEAIKWYEKASEHENSSSSNNLGHIYKDGLGVPKDINRANEYFKLASTQGSTNAMITLAAYYMNVEKDPKQARYWFDLAAAKGDFHAQLDQEEFHKVAKQLEIVNEIREQLPPITEEFNRIYSTGMKEGSNPIRYSNTFGSKFKLPELEPYAKNGSITAQRILIAMHHFDKAMVSFSKNRVHDFIHEFAQCCRHEYLVITLSEWVHGQLRELVTDQLKCIPQNPPSQLDKDVRVCNSYFVFFGNLQLAEKFIIDSKLKYPDEKFFHLLHIDLDGFCQKFKEGMELGKKAVQMFPDECEFLYSLAGMMRLANEVPHLSVIEAYQKFLKAAPKDHRKIPEVYYAIAGEYFRAGRTMKKGTAAAADKYYKEVLEYYQHGLEAEKCQLPCFLPLQDCPQKEEVENILRMFRIRDKYKPTKKVTSKSTPAPLQGKVNVPAGDGQTQNVKSVSSSELALQLPALPPKQETTDKKPAGIDLLKPTRIQLIKEHRQAEVDFIKSRSGEDNNGCIKIQHSFEAKASNRQQAPKSLAGLKAITFSDMDLFTDKVYKGFVLEVQTIEEPNSEMSLSIRVMLEDMNKDVCRAFIYNFEERSVQDILKKYGHGAKMSILNPYLRIAQDGKFGIRVDDIRSIIFHCPSVVKICAFCGNVEGELLSCKACKVYYCGKECQKMDWKYLKHQWICN